MTTDERVSLTEAGPESLAAIQQLAESVQEGAIGSGLRPLLLELLRIRASQINGCAFCLALHIRQALDAGEDQRRLDLLAAWRESTVFDAGERAALAFTESITLIHKGHLPDPVYRAAAAHFRRDQLVYLLWTVTVVNAYNRLAIATHTTGAP